MTVFRPLSCAAVLSVLLLSPALADDSLVNGKACNSFCRSWLGLPAHGASNAAAAPAQRPTASPPVAPSPSPVAPASNAERVIVDTPVAKDEGVATRSADTTRLSRAEDRAAVEDDETTSAARDRQDGPKITSLSDDTAPVQIVGNPHWKDYTDTVFQFHGSLLVEPAEHKRKAAPLARRELGSYSGQVGPLSQR